MEGHWKFQGGEGPPKPKNLKAKVSSWIGFFFFRAGGGGGGSMEGFKPNKTVIEVGGVWIIFWEKQCCVSYWCHLQNVCWLLVDIFLTTLPCRLPTGQLKRKVWKVELSSMILAVTTVPIIVSWSDCSIWKGSHQKVALMMQSKTNNKTAAVQHVAL